MNQTICYLKKLTSAEVGNTKAHVGGYLRLPNDFDYESFFKEDGNNNNGVIEIDFDAFNCNSGNWVRGLRFAYFDNSNKEKRIPNLATLYKDNNVNEGDVFKLESKQTGDGVKICISFFYNSNIITNASAIYYIDDNVCDDKNEIQRTNSEPLQQIFYGAPGTGKSFEINRITKAKEVIRTTFHPDSDYSTFVGAYKPTSIEVPVRDVTGKVIVEKEKQVTENRIVYEFVEQAFLQAYINAWKAYAEAELGGKAREQFLIIEEINRGNCAQIFGDLFQLLDRNAYGFSDYPITADKDMKKQLSKAFKDISIADAERINDIYEKDVVAKVLSGDFLLLPDNLYIWATMNTSDQSLFPIDSAFKRRWDWKYMPICEGKKNGTSLGWKIKVNNNLYDWWQFVEKINAEIGEQTKSEDKKLGYFFCKARNGIISAETFVSKVIFYLWNDVFKDQDFASDIFRNGDDELKFNKFYDVDNNGKTIIKSDVVELFLHNLKVEYIESRINSSDGNIEDLSLDFSEEGNNSEGRDNSKYSVNGEGAYGKNVLASECMREYLKLNPDMSVEEVLTNWRKLGYIVPHFVESKEEHDARTDKSTRFSEFPCNGTYIYVERNGYSRDLEVNNLINAVNKQDWGITLAKVEE